MSDSPQDIPPEVLLAKVLELSPSLRNTFAKKINPNGEVFDQATIGAAAQLKPHFEEMMVDRISIELPYENYPWAKETLKNKVYRAIKYLSAIDPKFIKFKDETQIDFASDENNLIIRYISTISEDTVRFTIRKREQKTGQFKADGPKEDWRGMVHTIVEQLETDKAKQISLSNTILSPDDKQWLKDFFLDLDEFTMHCNDKQIFIAKSVKEGEQRITIQ